MNGLLSKTFYGLFCAMAVLPLWACYCLSDAAFVLVYYVFRYRRRLVRRNLELSFPDWDSDEIVRTEREFYHHFCDTFFETIKLLNFSESRIKRHFVLKNDELFNYFLDNDRPVVLYVAHYANWEWVASIPLWVKQFDERTVGYLYRPLKNRIFDYLFVRIREKFGTHGFIKNMAYRDIIRLKRKGNNWLVCFLSDQKPSTNDLHFWTDFLNRDTPFMTGTAKIAKRTDAAVCYLDITKIRRSFYEGKIKLISDNPAETTEEEITERYVRFLEKSVLRNPALYLWSHNRWKYSRTEQ
jgi:KDO2-lipid IV(A) lauroyltransferase